MVAVVFRWLKKADGYHGIEAVIDKDLSAALLASQIHADALLISLMRTQYISTGASQPNARWPVTPELLNEMQFDAGSMGPKVTACAKFVSQCRGIAGSALLQMVRKFSPETKALLFALIPHNHA